LNFVMLRPRSEDLISQIPQDDNCRMEMSTRMILGSIFIIFSLIALGFLVNTIANLDQLKITITHPRVLVELFLFLVFLLMGIFLLYAK